jgi:hypothetical protein
VQKVRIHKMWIFKKESFLLIFVVLFPLLLLIIITSINFISKLKDMGLSKTETIFLFRYDLAIISVYILIVLIVVFRKILSFKKDD